MQAACALPSCGQSEGKLQRCSRCKAAWYCSAAHQHEDYAAHKLRCVAPDANPRAAADEARVRASIGTRYDPDELPLAQALRPGESLAVLLRADADATPQTMVITADDRQHYVAHGRRAHLMETGGSIPLVVASARGAQADTSNASAAKLLLGVESGEPATGVTGDVVCLRSDGKSFIAGDLIFCLDFAAAVADVCREQGRVPKDLAAYWKLHQRVRKHAFE